jgi:hypothetical protein
MDMECQDKNVRSTMSCFGHSWMPLNGLLGTKMDVISFLVHKKDGYGLMFCSEQKCSGLRWMLRIKMDAQDKDG